MVIKKILELMFLGVLSFGLYFLVVSIPLPCDRAIKYSLGVFDSRFDLSKEAFLREALSAEALWENALGKELFVAVPESAFRMNLIFDERQEQTLSSQRLEANLEVTQATQQEIEKNQQKKVALYEETSRVYERMLTAFKRDLDAYNKEVREWNRDGGNEEEYKDLEKTSRALERKQKEFEEKRQMVNRLASEVNAFAKEQISVVEKYNEAVDEYVDRYGEPGQFDQGEYSGTEINIYQYDDLPRLRAVLVHEFGHALGIAHGTDPQSLMFPLMKDQPLDPLVLSTEDKMMLETECHQSRLSVIRERMQLLLEKLQS